jgi:PadR family transcriptional regulator PadR
VARSLLLMDVIDRSGEEGYGYAIIRKLEEYSEGVFTFKEGTIYPILHSMQKQGMVTTVLRESPSGPARKCYKLTPLGKQALKAGLEEWREMSSVARKLLAGKEA